MNTKFEKITAENIKIIDLVYIVEETTRLGDILEFEAIDPCDFEVYRDMWEDYGYDMQDIESDGLYDFGRERIDEFIDALAKELKR